MHFSTEQTKFSTNPDYKAINYRKSRENSKTSAAQKLDQHIYTRHIIVTKWKALLLPRHALFLEVVVVVDAAGTLRRYMQ